MGVGLRRIRLIHWHSEEAEERAERLRAAGYDADAAVPDGRAALRALRDDPPDAVVIDLGRLPSHGRELGVSLRVTKATRSLPLVFVGGEPEKVTRVRELLPDAVFATWEEIGTALDRALDEAPAEPEVPESVFAAYEGVPLARKLGIGAGAVVGLVGAPAGFGIDDLPEGATLRDDAGGDCDLVLWFATTRAAVERDILAMSALARAGDLWVVWPKRASGRRSDLTQRVVRKAGLDRGLVDFKVASIDETWTGLRFRPRK